MQVNFSSQLKLLLYLWWQRFVVVAVNLESCFKMLMFLFLCNVIDCHSSLTSLYDVPPNCRQSHEPPNNYLICKVHTYPTITYRSGHFVRKALRIHRISSAVIFLLPAVGMTDEVKKQPMYVDNPAYAWDGLGI